MKKHATAQLIFAASALASQQAWALGFGRTVSDAVLGQSFTFTVPVHVEPGERFGGDCVSADVRYGDSLLSPNVVPTAVEPGADEQNWIVRVTASAAVSEPIIDVTLTAGCARAFSRRFTVFADPPTLTASAPVIAAPPAALAPTAIAAASAVDRAGDRATPAARAARAPHVRASAAATSPARPRVIRKGPTQALANELATARDNGSARTAKAGDRARLVLDAGVSRLKLDMEDPIIPPSASAASAVSADQDDAEARQFKALEQSIQAVRRDSAAARERAAALQAQLADAQSRGDWLPWMAGLLAVAAAAIAGLAWRLRQQSRLRHSAWFNESQLEANAPVERTSAPADVPPPPAPRPEPEPAAAFAPRAEVPSVSAPVVAPAPEPARFDAVVADVADVSATRPLDRQALDGIASQHGLPRELSVEELLDLEQQADFFIALGQEDAAVDLLMSHLRSAGGQSPLPYTKLLEIYRRQGDRSAYERIRARFNRRFNAYAPDWDTGPTSGRVLEDYPETVAMLENAWQSPLDAMALLEGLLFKRDDRSELFDLPAYRDILLLYSLARDVWQNGGGSAGIQVDVLLPIDDFGDLDAIDAPDTQPYPSAREVNEFGLTLQADPEQLTAFHMADIEDGGVGLELPGAVPAVEPLFDGREGREGGEGDVHAMLDELSLEPLRPAPPRPSPPDWDDGAPAPDPDAPAKR